MTAALKLLGDLLTEAEAHLEYWTRQAEPNQGRTNHLPKSRAFQLAYWQGRRDALRELESQHRKIPDET